MGQERPEQRNREQKQPPAELRIQNAHQPSCFGPVGRTNAKPAALFPTPLHEVVPGLGGLGLCLRREGNDAYALKLFKKALTADIDEGTQMFAEDQIRELEGATPLPAR